MMGTQPKQPTLRLGQGSTTAGRNRYNPSIATTMKVYPSDVIASKEPKPPSKEDKRRIAVRNRKKLCMHRFGHL